VRKRARELAEIDEALRATWGPTAFARFEAKCRAERYAARRRMRRRVAIATAVVVVVAVVAIAVLAGVRSAAAPQEAADVRAVEPVAVNAERPVRANTTREAARRVARTDEETVYLAVVGAILVGCSGALVIGWLRRPDPAVRRRDRRPSRAPRR